MRFLKILSLFVVVLTAHADEPFQTDLFKTSAGDLKITFIGHGSLMFTFGGTIIHVDPFTRSADYSTLPKANLILITHDHRDHLDVKALEQIRTAKTAVILTETCARQVEGGSVMANGDHTNIEGLSIEAVPAYNLVHKRENGQVFHPKGSGNGYVITFGNLRVYVAGDTENFPEMKELRNIDVAFLPMNLPYTMTPEMVADAVRMFHPRVLYPYHYGSTDTNRLLKLLKEDKGTEIRIRKM